MKQIKIGIIGIGRMGQIHLDNLMQKFSEVEVVAISDINEEARQWAEKYTISKFYFDYQDLISDQEVNTVVICSPTNQHAENIIAAAQAGKNIFCEKPMDLSIQTATKVLQIVEKAGVKFMLGFNRRFDPNFMKIKGLIEEGKVGDPQIVKITSRDPAPPPIDYIKSSGGMFLDMTIHDFDMARFMVSSKVISIFAVGRNLVDPNIGIAGDIDTAVVTITFDSGAIATIDNSRQAVYGYDQRVEVFGSEGMAGTENNKSDNHYYYNKKGQSESLPLHFFMDRYILSYFNEIKAFIDCIVHDEVPKVGGQDGLISLAMGWAANTSMQENRVVMLKEMLN
ncbi:MAG: inositol 2-dehydrogenase [Cytophagales bacterium]|jgi:myo-inositol 2-dehydrogenase/D-chiro-inositol 1-dehydrogenase|tara:strand:+ start:1220 stop:2233 length:1014 start_codon:yes stop_codon:yes gene_type:complete